MIIKSLNTLNEEIIKEIRELELLCIQYDNLKGEIFLDNSLTFNRDIKNIFLAYEDEKLISLIYMFIPRKKEAEISAYTMPEYRRRGYFKELLLRAIKELQEYNIPDILFVCESQSKNGKEVIKHIHGKYDFTEYVLKYNSENNIVKKHNDSRLELYKAKLEDMDTLITLNEKIFKQSYEEIKTMVMNTFKSQDRESYLGVLNGEFIGMGALAFDGDEVTIFDFGVCPKHQGRGIGQELLMLLIKEIKNLNRNNIILEVDSENERAFNLYKKCGFEIQRAVEYYRRKII